MIKIPPSDKIGLCKLCRNAPLERWLAYKIDHFPYSECRMDIINASRNTLHPSCAARLLLAYDEANGFKEGAYD